MAIYNASLIRRRLAATFAAFFTTAIATEIGAQELQLAAATSNTSHQLLNSPMGGRLTFQLPIWKGLSVRGSAERASATERYVGLSCSGLLNPASCPPEPLRRRASISDLTFGGALALWRREPLRVQLTAARHFSTLSTTTRKVGSGTTAFAGTQDYRGSSFGADFAYSPRQLRGLEIVAGVDRVTLKPHDLVYIADGYMPFTRVIRTTATTFGLGWRF